MLCPPKGGAISAETTREWPISGPSRSAFPRTWAMGKVRRQTGKATGYLSLSYAARRAPACRETCWGCGRCPGSGTLCPVLKIPASGCPWPTPEPRSSESPSAPCPTAPPSGKSESGAAEVPSSSLPESLPQLGSSLLINNSCPHKAPGQIPV